MIVSQPADFATLSRAEWLETNGLGGYAFGTVAGAGTRGYHALLTSTPDSLGQRTAVVTSCEESLLLDPPVFLSAHQYRDAIHPDGYRYLESFTATPIPTWTYHAGRYRIERRIFMVAGSNTTVVRYRLLAGDPIVLAVRPFFVFRDHHQRRTESDAWRLTLTPVTNGVRCTATGGTLAATIVFGPGTLREEPLWYRQFEYPRERERGLPPVEDAFAPICIDLRLAEGQRADWVVTTDRELPGAPWELERRERARRRQLDVGLPSRDRFGRGLAAATSAFVVGRRGETDSVVAGYPWFTAWGRDTMIALPGLFLSTGRVAEAEHLLVSFARQLKRGLLPNRFPGGGGPPEYDGVDTSLWFAVAVNALDAAGGDRSVIDGPLTRALERIEHRYAKGTDFGIHEDRHGLLSAVADGLALTWMDARVGDWVVTPRGGKPVEVNALWYNARRILAGLFRRQGRPADAERLESSARMTREAFERNFWDDENQGLVDCIGPDGVADRSVRPNQLFAASLPFPLVDPERARSMLELITRHLLTPRGLRTLTPSDPCYIGRYDGDHRARDAAYHQGTVWPWLLGGFTDALCYAYGNTTQARRRALAALLPLRGHMEEACYGQVSELFDGDAPHAPRGCPAQAWSVAEVFRAWRKAVATASGAVRARRLVESVS